MDDNLTEYSVSELSGAVKKSIEEGFGHVRVRGELGRVSRPSSGHIYVDLKDEKAVLASIIWKGVAAKLAVQPEQGLEVICTGRMTTFAKHSRYQLVIEQMEAAGIGALMASLEARKQTLTAEGLFNSEHKKPLPYLPDCIGVITSPSGAVIRDILHRLDDRFARRVLVWPVRVQGKTCAQEVARAIAGFNALQLGGDIPRPDVLIVARGGGSLEDLWGFNEEIVVRTVAQSDIPIISAVGHETDTTLIDYVADLSAPTPTAAAEFAVPVRAELQAQVLDLGRRQLRSGSKLVSAKKDYLQGLLRGLAKPEDVLSRPSQTYDYLAARLAQGLSHQVAFKGERFVRLEQGLSLRAVLQSITSFAARLEGLSRALARPEDVLARPSQTYDYLAARLAQGLSRQVAFKGERFVRLEQRLSLRAVLQSITSFTARLVDLHKRVIGRRQDVLHRCHERLSTLHKQLKLLSHESVLSRGFALVFDNNNQPVRTVSQAPEGSQVMVQLAAQQKLSARVLAHELPPQVDLAKTKEIAEGARKSANMPARAESSHVKTAKPKQEKLF